jgi:hypothetical protein
MRPNGKATATRATASTDAQRPAMRSPGDAGAVAMFSIARTSNAIALRVRAGRAPTIVRRATATRGRR